MAEHKILQKSYNDYLGVKEAGKELIMYAVGGDALAPLKQLYIGFRPSPQNGNQDDNSAEARVQDNGIEQPMGSDHKYHSVLHAARPFPVVAG